MTAFVENEIFFIIDLEPINMKDRWNIPLPIFIHTTLTVFYSSGKQDKVIHSSKISVNESEKKWAANLIIWLCCLKAQPVDDRHG